MCACESGVCVRVRVCVCRPKLRAGTFGPEAPAVTPQDSAVPATVDSQGSSAQTLFLANFSFSPLLLRPPSPQQIKCSSRRKTEAKGKERSSNTEVCSPGGSLLFTHQEVDFSVFSDSPRTSAGANGAFWPSSQLLEKNNSVIGIRGIHGGEVLHGDASRDPPLHFGKSCPLRNPCSRRTDPSKAAWPPGLGSLA